MNESAYDDRASLSPGVRSLLARLDTYADKMQPGKRLTTDQINTNQKELYLILQAVLSQPTHQDFVDAFNGTIAGFRKYGNGALSTLLASRNFYSVKLDLDQRRSFSAWINVFVILSKESLRRVLIKQVDLAKAYQDLSEVHGIRAVAHARKLMELESIA